LRQSPAHPPNPKHVKSRDPSLRRRYPVSSVLRSPPQPQTAQPASHEMPVGPDLPVPLLGFPVFRMLSCTCMSSPIPRQIQRTHSLVLLRQLRPSPILRRVGTCVNSFGACSVFTHITTCIFTKPLKRPFTSKAPTILLPPSPLRLLLGGANQFPGGSISH